MMYLSAKVQRFMHPYNTDIGVFCSHIFGIIYKKRGELHSLKSPPPSNCFRLLMDIFYSIVNLFEAILDFGRVGFLVVVVDSNYFSL